MRMPNHFEYVHGHLSKRALATLRISLVACACAATIPSSASAQGSHSAAIDWRGEESRQKARMYAGTQTRIDISNLSPVCFTYTYRVNQSERVESADNRLPGVLLGKDVTTLGPLRPSPPAAKAATTSTDAAKTSLHFMQSVEDEATRRREEARRRERTWEAELKEANSALDIAFAVNARADASLVEVTKLRDAAKGALTGYLDGACPAKTRGIAHATAVVLWTQSFAGTVNTFLVDTIHLRAAEARLDTVQTLMRESDARVARLSALAKGDPALSAYLAGDGAPMVLRAKTDHKALADRLSEQRKRVIEPVRGDRASADSLRAQIVSLHASTSEEHLPLYVKDNSSTIAIVITATGRAFAKNVQGVVITETREFPVHERTRIVPSVGFLISRLPQSTFKRTTRPRFAGDASLVSDSVYSTYVDVAASRQSTLAPLVQTHVSLVDWTVGTLYLSGGIAARTVGGEVGADYLAGLSFGVADRALITVGSHWGRREYLLLGVPDSVARRPVPVSVGDESAIGRRWMNKLALAMSWKF